MARRLLRKQSSQTNSRQGPRSVGVSIGDEAGDAHLGRCVGVVKAPFMRSLKIDNHLHTRATPQK